jgi:hypothetical protein
VRSAAGAESRSGVGFRRIESSSSGAACGPLLSFATDYFDARREPRPPGGQLRSCPPDRAAPVPPPLLRCVAHPTPSAAGRVGLRPRADSTACRIGPVGRAAERSKGGGVGRRPAPGDMSAAACPGGPISLRHLHSRRSTAATGRGPTLAFGRLALTQAGIQLLVLGTWAVFGRARALSRGGCRGAWPNGSIQSLMPRDKKAFTSPPSASHESVTWRACRQTNNRHTPRRH